MNRLLSTNLFTLCFIAVYFILSFALGLLAPSLFSGETGSAWMSVAVYLLGFGLPALAYGLLLRRIKGRRLSDTFGLHRISGKSVLLVLGAAITVQPVMMLISSISQMVFQNTTTSSMLEMARMPLWLFLLSSAALPAFFEELICRGIIFGGYSDTPAWYALLIPALFFGMLHLNFQQICYAVAGGVFFSLLVKATGSIWSSVLAHLVINGLQSLIAWSALQSDLYASAASAMTLPNHFTGLLAALYPYMALTVISLPLLILCVMGLFKINRRSPQPSAGGRRPVSPRWHQGAWPMYLILGFLFVYSLATEYLLRYLS